MERAGGRRPRAHGRAALTDDPDSRSLERAAGGHLPEIDDALNVVAELGRCGVQGLYVDRRVEVSELDEPHEPRDELSHLEQLAGMRWRPDPDAVAELDQPVGRVRAL